MSTIVGRHSRYDVDDTPFAHGGRAALYRVACGRLALKLFKDPLPIADDRRIERLVAEGREQFVRSRHVMGSAPGAAINWPVDVVAGSEGLAGVVLPLVPSEFMRVGGSLRTMEFLILRRGEPPRAHQRVAVLIRVAETLAWLADRKLVHGDVSPRNLVWAAGAVPKVILLDVDGVHDATTPSTDSVVTPGWGDPRVLDRMTTAHDLYSDWYALALFMYRGLFVTPGMLRKSATGWPTPTLPDGFSPRLTSLLHRSLDHPLEQSSRAHPREWVTALVAEFFPGQPNHAALRALDDLARGRAARDVGAQWQPNQPIGPRGVHHSPPTHVGPTSTAATSPPPPRRPFHRRLLFRTT